MKTDTAERIIKYIAKNQQARAHDIGRVFGIGQTAVHRQLNKLVEQGRIQRVGKPPLVFYVLTPPQTKSIIQTATVAILSANTATYIDDTYLYISPQGDMLYGLDGFKTWAAAIKQNNRIVQLSEEYVKIHRSAEAIRSSEGWIDATHKVATTFSDNGITKLLYGDFYSIPQFGKTTLGNLVLYAKQSQNRQLIDTAVEQVKPIIERIIDTYMIDTVAFVPPSVPRKLQFMQEFADRLALDLPKVDLVKSYRGDVIVPQKSLSDLRERVTNAQETIYLKSPLSSGSKNVLLIDDAVGSGATLTEIAKKLLVGSSNVELIVGFAIVGSFNGFEVIREI
jgi:adenine/guanine phosphoribosyltransferase-like PRPP-binding protein